MNKGLDLYWMTVDDETPTLCQTVGIHTQSVYYQLRRKIHLTPYVHRAHSL